MNTDPIAQSVVRHRACDEGLPPTPAMRRMIRRACTDHVAAEGLVPPVTLGELQTCSAGLLDSLGLDGQYLKFTIVVLNSEIHREALAAVPYDRRMLLLPQCLRDRRRCRADIDEFGLVCNQCGRCDIGAFVAEAEQLGYVVLVAEGSPVVTSLIQSGKIEGLIGVSCMEMLERVFPYIAAAGIPAMAVPLLAAGCKDTFLDDEWVWESIYLAGPDQAPGPDLAGVRDEALTWFSAEAVRRQLGCTGDDPTEAIAVDWLTRSGKRWRPVLTACVYRALAGESQPATGTAIAPLALAVECFHKASLVHDDIEDGDQTRYGRTTLHAAHGVPVALNVGDLLVGLGYRLIASLPVPPDRIARMSRAAAAAHAELCRGQGLELAWCRDPRPLTPDEVLEILRRKTAPAFEVAIKLGAICAGAEICQTLTTFSAALGTAYQIRDDLEDFDREWLVGDAASARPSLLLALAHEAAVGEAARLLDRIWRDRGAALEAVELRRIITETGAEERARSLLERCRARALASLRPLAQVHLKRLLRRVVARIFNEVDELVCCNDHHPANARRGPAGEDRPR